MNTEFIINEINAIEDTDKDAIDQLKRIFYAAEKKINAIAIETETETYILGGSIVNNYGDYWDESESTEWTNTWNESSYGC